MNKNLSLSIEAVPACDGEIVCNVSDLTAQHKRVLRMQFKEFVHHIEDAEEGFGVAEQVILTTVREQRVA